MNKKNKKILYFSILFFLILGIFIAYNYFNDKTKNTYIYNDNIKISINKNMGNNIYIIENQQDFSNFSKKLQDTIDNNINYLLLNNNYKFSKPLIIINPYSTNELSFNIYFKNNGFSDLSYNISVDDKNIPDFNRKSFANKMDNGYYGYYVTGLVKNKVNNISLTLKNKLGFKKSYNFKIDLSNYNKSLNDKTFKLNINKSSLNNSSDGLFLVNTRLNDYGLELPFYDENGIKRASLVNNESTQFKVFFDNDRILYPLNKNNIIVLDNMGRVINIYNLGSYYIHHNYDFNKDTNTLYILANSRESKSKSRNEVIISLNLDTKEVKETINLKDLLGDMKDIAISWEDYSNKLFNNVKPKNNNAIIVNILNWIHLNSVVSVNKNDLIISSRELSSLIYIENINNKPKIKYIMASDVIYKDTKYQSLLLKQENKFINHAGQHSIIYEESDKKGIYYLTIFNNSYGFSPSRPDFDWDSMGILKPYDKNSTSYIYKYEVNENKNTYKLVNSFKIPYTKTQGNVFKYLDNYIVTSSFENKFYEYNSDGEILSQYSYPLDIKTTQLAGVYKYDFLNFWFKKR